MTTVGTDLGRPALHELQLPGVELTETGAKLVGPVDEAAAVGVLARLARSESWSRWVVGDLFLAIVAAHDGDHGPAYEAVAGCGFTPAWLNQSIAVAERVPPENRRAALSWSHHRVVANPGVPVEVQSRMLGGAVANGWNARTLATSVDQWLGRDQEELDVGGKPPAPKLSRSLVKAILEAAEVSPSGWVRVHPESGQVRAVMDSNRAA